MRVPDLRQTLIQLVLSAAPLAASGCGVDDDPCSEIELGTARVSEPPPASLLFVVRACEADADQCMELCRQATSTDVVFCSVEHDSTGHDLTYGYRVWTGGDGCPVEGRRPHGLAAAFRSHGSARGSAPARHLARSAFHEAASVHAFVHIARELRRHDAPRALVRAAQRSAVDEIAHARVMAALAVARGATPPRVVVARPARRSIEALAIENAREGVVGETWAAMIACWQATRAASSSLRDAFAGIARDELRHAELAVQIDSWARTRLGAAARRRVDHAKDRAVTRLARGVRRGPSAAIVRELGMPDGPAMQQLFERARARLWA